jgi:hypothetical protein
MDKIGEPALAVFERLLAEIVAVELDQIEGAQHGGNVDYLATQLRSTFNFALASSIGLGVPSAP